MTEKETATKITELEGIIAEQNKIIEELELKAKLEQELPVEQDLSRWFALYGAPL